MIIRKIRLTEYEYQPPINFVAGATEPDIQFQLVDYAIPAGAEARAYVQRFDGTFEYTVATIDGNNVTVEPTSSMFSVRGEGAIQITLYAGDEVLKNFSVPVFVHADLADENAEQGSDVTGVFRAAEEEALADFQEQAEEIAEEVKESIPEDYTELTEEVSELNERLVDAEAGLQTIDDVLAVTPASINLFDEDNMVDLIPQSGGTTIVKYTGAKSVWIKAKANTTITLEKTDGNRCQALTFTSQPASGDAWVQNVLSPGGNTGLSVSVTVGATDIYVLFYLATSSGSVDLTKVKIYYGTQWKDEPTSVIGDLDELVTTSKNNLVNAINEAAQNSGAVASVNGKTGTVVLGAEDVGALAEPSTAGTSGQVLATDGDGGTYWTNQSGGGSGSVDSVNGKTGVVVLDADDVGAASEEDVTYIKSVLEIGEPGTVNLFDAENPNTTNLIPKTDGSGQITTSNGVYAVLLQVEPNTTVTMTKADGNRCQICSFASPPQKNDYWVQNVMSSGGNTGLSVTITVGATDVYLLFYMATSSSSCDYTKLKIFYGTEWHDATPNIIDTLTGKFFNVIPEINAFNLMSERPLGSLTKPYIAISCDDGAADLATTTIPLFKGYKTTYNQNVPLTMGLMSTSAVLNDATYTALVNEMLSDYGCEVATHGGTSYTSYANDDLVDFLNAQETFINGKCGRKPVGIIYPNHAYDLEKKVIAGSYYGVCAAGYSQGVIYSQCNGARSNMYELHRWSLFVSSQTTATIETVVDYCYANKMLLMPWFHDNALTGADAENNISLLNHLISYGMSKGIDFISFKDIPKIV